MMKSVLWTCFGLFLSVVCGLADLAHLSATFVTLTVFICVPTLVVGCITHHHHARIRMLLFG
jgi:hypothetical protein